MIATLRKWPIVVFEALLAVAFGALLAVALTAFVSAAWPTLYARFPNPGYENAVKAGTIEPLFTNSPRAWRHATVAFVVGGVLVGLVSRVSSFVPAQLSWCSLWIALIVLFNLSPSGQSNLAFLSLLLFPILTVPFLVAALLTQAIRRKLRGSPD
jgi:hypothetical protein